MAVLYGGTGSLYATGGGVAWNYVGATTGTITLNYTVATSNTTLISCWLPTGGRPGYDRPVPVQYWQPQIYTAPPPRPPTAAERQRAERRAATLLRAKDRAMELLMSVLTAEQAHAYVRDGWFDVRGSDGGLFRVYRRGQQGNVREIIGGREVAKLCCHPPGGLPDADAHLAQLLHLETDERGFRATANRTALWQPAAA